MTKYRYVDVVRDPSDGSGQAGVTVTLKKLDGNATVTSDGTDANGRAEMPHDTVGYPGPVYSTATSGATTRVRSGEVWGQLGGLIWADDVSDVFTTNGIGVVPGAGSELACTASGSNMIISVAAGMAILKDGLPYVLDAASSVTLTNGDASNPRIDRVVLRLTREEQTDQGQIILTKITGTPAASPAAPSLTQDSTTWDLPLCQVAVAQSATTVANGNLTDQRTYCWTYPLTTRGDILYVNSAGKPARLAIGAANTVLKSDGTDVSWGTAPLIVQEGDSTVDSAVTTLDFDASDFNVTSSPSGEANIALNYGTGSGQPAEGDHTHASSTITVQEEDVNVDTSVTTFDFDGSDFNVTSSPAGEVNISLNYGTSAGQPSEGNHSHSDTVGFSVNLGNGSDVITSSEPPVFVTIPYGATITGWRMRSSVSGSITLVVAKAATGSSTFTTISGSEAPSLSSQTFNSDTSLSTWTTAVTANDCLKFTVTGTPATVVRVECALTMTKTIGVG